MQATNNDLRSNPAVERIVTLTKATGHVTITDVSTLRPVKIVSQRRIRAIMMTISCLIVIVGMIVLRYL